MKTVKITEWVHKELKLFSAKSGDKVSTITDSAILSWLVTKGHKITQKPKK